MIEQPAPSSPKTARASRWQHLLPLPFYLLLTIIFSWPLVLHLGDSVILAGGSDAWAHLWNLWWTRHALLDLHQSPFQTDYLFYPTGVSLRFHALNQLGGLFAIPLQAFFSLTTSFNLLVILNLTLAAWGAYLLANYVLALDPRPAIAASPYAALVAGVVFAYCAAAASFVRLGQLELISIQWLPFGALYLLRALRPPYRWRDAVVAAAFIILASQHTWYYGLFLLVFAGLLILWQVTHPEPMAPAAEGRAARLLILRQAAIALGGFALVVSPLLLAMGRELAANKPVLADESFIVYNAAALPQFVQPGPSLLWGNAALGITEVSWFIGLFAGLLAVGGVVAGVRAGGVRRRYTSFFALSGLFCFLLALGPYLKLGPGGLANTDAQDVDALFHPFGKDSRLPLPFYLLRFTPLGSIARVAGRFSLPGMLCVAVLATLGTAALLAAVHAWGRNSRVTTRLAPVALPLLLCLLVFVESVPTGGQPLTSTISPALYHRLAQDAPGSYAVLELPNNCAPQYELYQTVHQQKVLGGYISRKYDYPFAADTPAIRQLFVEGQLPAAADIISRNLALSGATILNYYGIRYVNVHLACFAAMPPPKGEVEKNQLLDLINVIWQQQQPTQQADDILTYRVPPPPTSPPLAVELAGGGWYPFQSEPNGHNPSRWTSGREVGLSIWSPVATSAQLTTTIYAYFKLADGSAAEVAKAAAKMRHIRLNLNDAPLTALAVKNAQQQISLSLNLRAGSNLLSFYSEEPAEVAPRQVGGVDPYPQGLAFGFLNITITPNRLFSEATPMSRLTASNYHLNLDGQPLYLRAGELHYFRIAPNLWPAALRRLKEAGFNAIASYIPWVWHEPQEGVLDFAGTSDPRRNLLGLLDLLHEFELPFIARPGPFIYAEYNGLGHPLWLGERYPQTVMRGPGGKLIRGDFWYGHAMGDPTYRAKVAAWIAAVASAIQPYLDKPVVAWQLDNEPGFVQQNGLGLWDFNPATRDQYRAWLLQRYGDLASVGKAHHRKYVSEAGLEPPRKGATTAQALDWQQFYEGYVVDYLRWLRGVAEGAGITLPIILNTALTYHSPCDPHTQAAVGDWQGIDIYLKQTAASHAADFPWGGSTYPAVVKPEVRPDKPLLAFELGSGWFDPRSNLSDAAILQSYVACLAHGLRGSVMYSAMDGVEIDGSLYQYQAILDKDAQPGPRYELISQLHRFISQHTADLLAAKEIYDEIGYAYYQPNYRFSYAEYLPLVGLQNPVQYFSNFHGQHGPFAVLLNAGYNPRPLNLATVSAEELQQQRVIFFPSKGYADRAEYAKLLAYVKAGGHLVTFPQPLRYDLQGNGLLSGELYPEVVSKERWLGLRQALTALASRWLLGYNRQRKALLAKHPYSGHIMDAFEPILVFTNTKLPTVRLDSVFGGQVRGDYYLAVQDGQAQPLLRHKGQTVAYTTAVGKGSSTLIGTVLGGHYMSGQYYASTTSERAELRSFMRALVTTLGVGCRHQTSLDIEVVSHKVDDGYLLYLLNRLPDHQRGRIKLQRLDSHNLRGKVATLFSYFGSTVNLASWSNSLVGLSFVELIGDLAPNDCVVVKIS